MLFNDSPISIACTATLIFIVIAWVAVVLISNSKTMRIIGYVLASLVFLGGAAFSVMIHFLHVGMSGDPAESPLWWMLLITLAISLPIAAATELRARALTRRPGCCGKCGYDMRGNLSATNCPECGELYIRASKRK